MEIGLAILVGVGGMLAHFWKRKLKRQTIDGLKQYVLGHPAYTVAALVVTFAGSWAYGQALPPIDLGNLTGLLAQYTPIFTAGYMVDSAINKAVSDS